jgi:hypothetical protein
MTASGRGNYLGAENRSPSNCAKEDNNSRYSIQLLLAGAPSSLSGTTAFFDFI